MPCFPPNYKIFEFSVECIHNLLQAYFKSLFEENKLKEREFFILISWLPRYKSESLMGNKELGIEISKLTNLIEPIYYKKALSIHLAYVSSSVNKWFKNILERCYSSKQTPIIQNDSKTKNDFYRSNIAYDIEELVRQQLELAFTLEDDILSQETIKLILAQLNFFTDNLKSDFKKIYSIFKF